MESEVPKSESSEIVYERVIDKPMKHEKDICRTNVESTKSENVKGLSLDDVIAQRKIHSVKQENKRKLNNSELAVSEDIELSLDEVIQKRKIPQKSLTEMNQSLDEIIKQGNGHMTDDEESKSNDINGDATGSRKRKREGHIEGIEQPFIPSPLDVAYKLIEDGLVIQVEIGKQEDLTDGRAHNWRVKYVCGDISVQCESARKILAKQGAAHEFLTQLKDLFPGLEIPRFKIPEACYYDPVVCNRLEEIAASLSLSPIKFETVQTRMSQRDFFTTTYSIGEDEFAGCSFDVDHSKILAAKAAYETYSGKKFYRDTFFLGDKCNKSKEYKCRETEASHIITLTTLPESLEKLMGKESKRRKMMQTEPEVEEEEELLVDESGQMYVLAADGSNHIRKLNPVSLDEIIEERLMEISATASD